MVVRSTVHTEYCDVCASDSACIIRVSLSNVRDVLHEFICKVLRSVSD